MDAQELARRGKEAYCRELLKERETEIRKQTLKKVQVITRSMQPGEEAAYLQSKAFQNALNQTRKKDRIYQAIRGGELPEDWEAEYRRLQPLIESEIQAGNRVDLAFLRSAARTKRSLKECRQARRIMAEIKLNKCFRSLIVTT